MLREAQTSPPFYATKDDFECVGPLILGMAEPEPIFESGQVGPRLELFKEPRANNRIYYYIPRMIRDTVNYLAFSSLDKLSFTPDVLIVTANPTQAEIILRAMTYTTGKMWTAKGTSVIECAWLFVYPYLSGELNFTVTGFSSGMKAREVFPPDLVLISIPWDLLPTLVETLQDMKWVPIEHTRSRDENSAEFKKLAEAITAGISSQVKLPTPNQASFSHPPALIGSASETLFPIPSPFLIYLRFNSMEIISKLFTFLVKYVIIIFNVWISLLEMRNSQRYSIRKRILCENMVPKMPRRSSNGWLCLWLQIVLKKCLTDPPERRHELSGNRKGQFAVDLKHPQRLIFEPNHNPLPRRADGGLDLKKIMQ